MRSAMATAAGVAGGVLAAESIRNMLGGSHAKAAETGAKDDKQALAEQDRKQDLEQDRELEQADQDQDQGDYDTAEDDSGDFGDDSLDV
jgi:hypothetical protein